MNFVQNFRTYFVFCHIFWTFNSYPKCWISYSSKIHRHWVIWGDFFCTRKMIKMTHFICPWKMINLLQDVLTNFSQPFKKRDVTWCDIFYKQSFKRRLITAPPPPPLKNVSYRRRCPLGSWEQRFKTFCKFYDY